MTIKDLWDQFLNADLIPIFEAFVISFGIGLAVLLLLSGGAIWWLHRRSK